MDKQQAIKETKEAYEKSLVIIDEAEKVCKKIEPLLPKEWYSIYHSKYQQLEFTRLGKADAIEFRVVCDLVEKALDVKLYRGIAESMDKYLYAWDWYYPEGKNVCLDVRVELNKPEGCKITYKRKWSKEPVVDEACLGIRKEKEREHEPISI